MGMFWKPSRARRRWRTFLALSLTALVVGLGSVVLIAEHKLSRLVLGGLGEGFSTRVYSAPYFIRDKQSYDLSSLFQRLKRLGYKPAGQAALAPGDYDWSAPTLRISLRGFEAPHVSQSAMTVRLQFRGDRSIRLEDESKQEMEDVALEPELVEELSGPVKIRREPAQWEEFPVELIDAVLTAEDRRFFQHWGIDWRAVFRAAGANLIKRGYLQGGSTITQQLVKNIFLTPRRTVRRKIAEAAFALYIDFRLPKEKILTLYLNHIYTGQDGITSIAGMKAAAQFYLGKSLNELSLSDCAFLAGVIRSPHAYNPFENYRRAKARRNAVLKNMWKGGLVTQTDYLTASAAPLNIRLRPPHFERAKEDDYFVAEVLRQMIPQYGEDVLFRYGLKIYTTMDPWLQESAYEAVQKTRFQVALVALDPFTGQVQALVGGKNYRESQFNRATQALRQPGSAFKPFIYGAALETGFTVSTFLHDQRKRFADRAGAVWEPRNYDGIYHGTVTIRQALANSMNSATLDLLSRVGPEEVIRFARKVGVNSPLENSLALALGSSEVQLLELVAAYAPFANGGYLVRPQLVASVVDAEGKVLEVNPVEKESVLDPALAYVMTSLMASCVKEGTAKRLSELGWTSPAAGKTGTTNGGRDAWFIGYTPERLAGVWVGDDEAKSVNLAGSRHALPIWADFMMKGNQGVPVKDFVKPDGVVTGTIDPQSGFRARSGCPTRKEEVYIKGTEPKRDCPLHPGGLKGWFQKLFKGE
ncbi:MAG: PBP1A family penicillin-binding protein [Elusimicrobia bacterium]|nr:PBP1A family penicillin-binding protein [Candidatus Obscuribacterium magneticum]